MGLDADRRMSFLGVSWSEKDRNNALFTGLAAAIIGAVMDLQFASQYTGQLPRTVQFGLAGAGGWLLGRLLKKKAGF